MARRVKFRKGGQRKFLLDVMARISCPSLRRLNQYGLEVNYSTLKNYFVEERLLPEDLFRNLCVLAGVDEKRLKVEFLEEGWGRVLGGSVSRRQKIKR